MSVCILSFSTHTHTHTHIYIYIYIYSLGYFIGLNGAEMSQWLVDY